MACECQMTRNVQQVGKQDASQNKRSVLHALSIAFLIQSRVSVGAIFPPYQEVTSANESNGDVASRGNNIKLYMRRRIKRAPRPHQDEKSSSRHDRNESLSLTLCGAVFVVCASALIRTWVKAPNSRGGANAPPSSLSRI